MPLLRRVQIPQAARDGMSFRVYFIILFHFELDCDHLTTCKLISDRAILLLYINVEIDNYYTYQNYIVLVLSSRRV